MLLTVTEVDLYEVGFDEIVEPDNETDRPLTRGSKPHYSATATTLSRWARVKVTGNWHS